MDERTLSISNVPVSFLEPLEKGKDLGGSELFLVSMPVSGESGSGYISKSITYNTVITNLYKDLDIERISSEIARLSNDLHVPAGVSYLSTSGGSPYEYPTVISAVAENNRGRIVGVSGYVLSDAVVDILGKTVLPTLSAATTPWLKKTEVTSDIGNSTTLAASQKLATEISSRLSTYVSKDDIAVSLGNNEDKVAAQSLVSAVSAQISSTYVSKLSVTSSSGTSEELVASQNLVNILSTFVKTNFVANDEIATTLDDETGLVASQSLVQALSDTVRNNYVLTSRFDNYVPFSNVKSELGDSDRYVASQKLVTSLCSEVSSKFPVGQAGQVYYLSPNGDIIKQTILNLDVYVCETNADITASVNQPFSFRDVFTNWQKGGKYGVKWYGYDADYPKPDAADKKDNYGYPFWYYDDSISSIVQPKNTNDYSFFVSQQNYSKYEVSCRMYSSDIDDDVNGLIVAYTEDSSGRPHTLSLIRTPNKQTADSPTMPKHHWLLAYDYSGHFRLSDFLNACVISTELSMGNDGSDASGDGWKEFTENGGVAVKAVRNGNTITGWTGPFASSGCNIETSDSRYKITIDLDNPSSNTGFAVSKLDVFKGASKIGFSTLSQPSSMYEVGTFKTPKVIIDSRKNSISSYYDGVWSTDEFKGVDPVSYVGIGRLVKNTATNKTFYVTTHGFVKFAEY